MQPVAKDHLSSIDAFFLYLEQPGAPMSVASISTFEGRLTLAECRRHFAARLDSVPRFMQRVVFPPLGLGRPTWQPDPRFDLRHHIGECTLEEASEAALKDEVSRILSTHLDRNRPLWQLTLIHGAELETTTVVLRMHHCMADGVAGVGMLKRLFDDSPDAAPPKRSRRARATQSDAPLAATLLEGFFDSCFDTAEALLAAEERLLRMVLPEGNHTTSRNSSGSSGRLRAVGDVLAELATPVMRLPYNRLCHGPQRFEWLALPMEQVLALKYAASATVNDVVLTTLALTLARYAQRHRLPLEGRTLRLVAPVNVRCAADAQQAGNQITFLPVDIPLTPLTPREMLGAVQQKVALARGGHSAEMVALVMTLLGAAPSPTQQLVGSILSQLPISVCNSICTNVHGSPSPLYMAGHKMLTSYPYVPIGGEMGMNCAVLSYNGTLFAGFTGDLSAIPDLERMPAYFTRSFEQLMRAFGQRPRAQRPRRQRSSKLQTISEPVPEATPAGEPEPAQAQVAVA